MKSRHWCVCAIVVLMVSGAAFAEIVHLGGWIYSPNTGGVRRDNKHDVQPQPRWNLWAMTERMPMDAPAARSAWSISTRSR